MENIVYLKNNQQAKTIYKPETWFGTKQEISKSVNNNFFTDTSLHKQNVKKRIQKEKFEKLLQRQSLAQNGLNKVLRQLHNISLEKQTKRLKEEDYMQRELEKQLMEKSAIKIQALARGFLVRKKYEDFMIIVSKKEFYKRMKSLKDAECYCFLSVGLIVKNAANKLQRFLKNALFRMKIKRIHVAYLSHLEDLKAPLYNYLNKVLLTFHCKEVLKDIRWENRKTRRLKEIRVKLALMSIKTFMKKRRLNMKILRNKIKRYKRLMKFSHQTSLARNPTLKVENDERKLIYEKLLALKNPKVSVNITPPLFSEVPINTNSFSNTASPLPPPADTIFVSEIDGFKRENSNNEAIDQTKLKTIEEQKDIPETPNEKVQIHHEHLGSEAIFTASDIVFQENHRNSRIQNGFSSLGIYKSKENNIVPILYQRELEIRPQTHHFNRTNACISRMFEVNPSRQVPKLRKKPVHLRVQSAASKPPSSPTYRYLNQTISSKLKIEESESEPEEDFAKFKIPRRPHKIVLAKPKVFAKNIVKKTSKSRSVVKNKEKKAEVLVPTVGNGSFRIRAEVKYVKSSRVQTPKSTKSCSIRRQSAPLVRRNSDFTPVSMTFEAALPEYSELLSSLMRPLYLHLRPKTGNRLA